jgi:hypothetical protein
MIRQGLGPRKGIASLDGARVREIIGIAGRIDPL